MAESRIIEFVEERNESSLRFLEQRKESPLRPLDDRNESSLLRDRRCAFGVDSRSDCAKSRKLDLASTPSGLSQAPGASGLSARKLDRAALPTLSGGGLCG